MPPSRTPPLQNRGFTLIEMLLATAIVAIAMGLAVLTSNPVQPFVLEKAVSEIRLALRTAQQHAREAGTTTVVDFGPAPLVRVSSLQLSSGTVARTPLTHPINKQPYIVQLDDQNLSGTTLQLQAVFNFADGTQSSSVAFNDRGEPVKVTATMPVPALKETGIWRGFWRIAEGYDAGDWVEHNGKLYDSKAAHVAGSSFEADLSSGRWAVRTIPGQISVSAGPHRYEIHLEPLWGFTRVKTR